jgi:hypothetical protein
MSEPHPGSPPFAERSETEKGKRIPDVQSTQAGEEPLPPIVPGFVRPVTDPEAIERWRAAHERPLIEFDPFANHRMR